MKKFIILFIVLFVSCGQAPKEESEVPMFDSIIIAEESSIDISMLDTMVVDSTSIKMSTLLSSTEHADRKLKEIKAIKQENIALKKELVETKAELQSVKSVLIDTVESTKKKKSFIQKVISTIKKDTTQ